MAARRDPAVLARMKTLFELYELAEQMQLQRLRREFPGAPEKEIEARFLEWLRNYKPLGWRDSFPVSPRDSP